MAELRRLVTSRSARREGRRIVLEGPRLLAEALDASVPVHEVFSEDPRPGATVVRPGVLDRIGDAATSQGVLAVAAAPPLDPAALAPWPDDALVIVLVDVGDPGNVGTLIRTADAVAATAVVLAGACADVLSPKVLRSSAGSVLRVPLAEVPDARAALGLVHGRGLVSLATVPRGGASHHDADLTGGVALLLGSEAHGLDPTVVAAASGRLTIPMAGRAESLNVAMAGTVLAFEAARQRSATGLRSAAAQRQAQRP